MAYLATTQRNSGSFVLGIMLKAFLHFPSLFLVLHFPGTLLLLFPFLAKIVFRGASSLALAVWALSS